MLKFYRRDQQVEQQTQRIQPGPDFRHPFEVFERTAFRLEVRDRYDAPYENESLKFHADEQDDLP